MTFSLKGDRSFKDVGLNNIKDFILEAVAILDRLILTPINIFDFFNT